MSFIPDDPPNGHFPVKGISLDGGKKSSSKETSIELISVEGNPEIRKELREFKKDETMWNLYLLGLWQFQLVPMDKQLSYFQIAGIHGDPRIGWPANDAKLQKLKKNGRDFWFCTHTSVLFLSWHRPYLALFETVLQKAMLHVANKFTVEEGREKYLAAAKAFRMPYWDWARPDLPRFPEEAVQSDKVQVPFPEQLLKEMQKEALQKGLTRRSNGLVEIDNPLYAYKFQSGIDKAPYTSWRFKVDNLPTTTRHHRPGDPEESPLSKRQLLLNELQPLDQRVSRLSVERNVGERVVYLLKSYKSYAQVCNNRLAVTTPAEKQDQEGIKVRGPGYGSLEDVHNTIHGMVGGGPGRTGHMGNVGVSSFDPIFWLHHTNIDRLLHIWQGLNYDAKKADTWVTTRQTGGSGSWVTLPFTNEELTTPLAPFYENDEFWTSDGVRDTKTFGYAYPETKSWNFKDPQDYKTDIKRQLDTLYWTGSLATMITARRSGDKAGEEKLKQRATMLRQVTEIAEDKSSNTASAITALSVINHASPILNLNLAEPLPPVTVPAVEIPKKHSLLDLAKDGSYLEWLVNIKAEKHSLDGLYEVHVFLGRVPEDEPTSLYPVSPFHVGTFTPLGQSPETGCDKCKNDQAERTEISGQIPLTIALAERYLAGELESFSEDAIVEYLKINLHWEVVGAHGERLQNRRNRVEGLLVNVASNEVKLPTDEHEFPYYSQDIKVYAEITTKEDASNGGRAEGTGATDENKYLC